MWICLPYMNLYLKTSRQFYRQFTKAKLKCFGENEHENENEH